MYLGVHPHMHTQNSVQMNAHEQQNQNALRLLPVVCRTEVVNSMNGCDIKLLITRPVCPWLRFPGTLRNHQSNYAVTVSFICSSVFTIIYLAHSFSKLMEGACTKSCTFGVSLKNLKRLSVVAWNWKTLWHHRNCTYFNKTCNTTFLRITLA